MSYQATTSETVRASGVHLIAIDDLADRELFADVVINRVSQPRDCTNAAIRTRCICLVQATRSWALSLRGTHRAQLVKKWSAC